MLVERNELCQLIPHAGSMCLLDGVLAWDEKSIRCISRSHLLTDNPLRKNNSLSTIHAMEYGAQAMAVHGGLLARAAGEKHADGYLAALRDVKLYVDQLDKITNALTIEATQLVAGNGNLMYEFEVKADETLIASARATVVTQPNDAD